MIKQQTGLKLVDMDENKDWNFIRKSSPKRLSFKRVLHYIARRSKVKVMREAKVIEIIIICGSDGGKK